MLRDRLTSDSLQNRLALGTTNAESPAWKGAAFVSSRSPVATRKIPALTVWILIASVAALAIYFLEPRQSAVLPSRSAQLVGGVRGFAIAKTELAEIGNALPAIRHLHFRADVPIVIESEDAALNDLRAHQNPRYGDEFLKFESQYYSMLGLAEPGADFRSEQRKMIKHRILGFYEPSLKRMVILSGVSADDKSTVIELLKRRNYKTETTLAHEMTHALQDQNFGLEKVEGISDNTDRLTAMKSVIEGDATVTGFIYGLQNGNFDENGINIDFGNRPGEIPWEAIERISSRMPFQYSAGAHFVAEAYKRHGWAGVNRLFSNPPVSSQQIAYPEYYFDSPRMPLQIRIKGYERVLQGWTPVANDTLGVLLIAGAFARGTVWAERVEGPLRHWSGDRLLVLRKQNDLFLVWMVAFDNPVDAATFASIYSQALDKATRAPDKATQVSDKGLKALRLLARHGKMVLVLIGANSSSSALSSALWSQTTVEPHAPSAERSARADLNG